MAPKCDLAQGHMLLISVVLLERFCRSLESWQGDYIICGDTDRTDFMVRWFLHLVGAYAAYLIPGLSV